MEHGVNHLESLVDFLPDFGASEYELAAYEDEKHNLGLDHAVDETREQLGFVGAEVVVLGSQTLETDRELDVARADDVLDLEIRKLGVETKLLNDTGILARGKLRVVLRLGAGHDHLAGGEDKRGRLRFTDAHDDGRETLSLLASAGRKGEEPIRQPAVEKVYLWVVLGVPRVQGDRLQVQTAI